MIHPMRSALVCALVAGIAMAPARAQGDLESLLPEGTMICTGSQDLDAFLKEAKSKAMGKILGEQEVKDFLEKPMAQMQQMMDMGIAMAKSQPALADVEMDPAKLLKGPFGKAVFALTHVDLPLSPGGIPDIGVVMALEVRDGAIDVFGLLRNVVQSLAANEGATLQISSIEVGGVTVEKTVFEEDGPPLCFAKVGSLSIMSLSEKSVRDIVARASGTPGSTASLAENEALGKAKAALGAAPKASATAFLAPGALIGLLRNGLEIAKQNAGEQDAMEIDMVLKGIDFSELEKIGASYSLSAYDGDVAVTRAYSTMDPQAKGLVGALRSFMKPVDKDLIRLIPTEAVSFSLANMDIAPLWDTVMAGMKAIAPEVHAEAVAQIQGFAAMVGGVDADGNPQWDPRRDLIGAIGGSYFSMSTPGAASMFGQSSNMVAFLGCSNPQGFQRSLELLIALPGQMAGFPIKFKEKDHAGVKMQTLDAASLGPAAMIAAMVQPTYAIAKGRFYMASSPTALANFLDSEATPPAKNVTERPDFQRHWSKLPEGAVFTSLSYGDTKSNFENMYHSALGILPMAMMNMPIPQEEMPVDINLLPTAEAISQHLFGSVNATMEPYPGVYISEMRSPFGMETMVGMGGMAILGAGVVGMRAQSAAASGWEDAEVIEQAVPDDPTDQAWMDLQNISVAITVFTVESDAPPTSLAELTMAKPGYPSGFLPTTSIPVDPWGQPYQYTVDADGGYMIWSNGPNGVDEKGAGDDIKIERR